MIEFHDDKVVQMNPERPAAPRAPALLQRCWERFRKPLGEALTHMLDKVDDALFEMAEKAESDSAQQAHFDAMRAVRRSRGDLEEAFQTSLRQAYEGFAARRGQAPAKEEDDRGQEAELSLVADEEIEESLAITNMVGKVHNLGREELFALNKRLAALLKVERIDEEGSPFSPETIVHAFKDACGSLEAGLQVRLIVFKLFDRFVIGELPTIYEDLNGLLRYHDILPEIRIQVPRQPRGAARGGPETGGAGAQATGAGGDLLQLLQQVAGTANLDTGTGQLHAVLPRLTALQQASGTGGAEVGGVSAASAESANIIRQLRASGLAGEMGQLDRLTMDMVATIFDYAMADRDIPDRFRALVGRLQIPVLKVALMDKGFFARKTHPARRVLDALSESALLSPEQASNELFDKARQAVDRITEEFEDDLTCFEEEAERLEEAISSHRSRVSQTESAATESEARKERVSAGRARVMEELDGRLEGRDVPSAVDEFLRTHWASYLLMCYVRDGELSEAWEAALTTVDRLLSSLEPRDTREERRTLAKQLPDLLGRLREGMDAIALPDSEREAFLEALAARHRDVVTGRAARPPSAPGASASKVARSPAGGTGKSPDEGSGEPTWPDSPSTEAVLRQLGFPEEAIQELLSPDGTTEEVTLDGGAGQAEEDSYTDVVRKLPEGTWLEFHDEEHGPERAKLAWVSQSTGTYLFTDWQGSKYADKSLHGLAAELRRGNARIVEDSSFLDRAINSLVNGYRRSARRALGRGWSGGGGPQQG